VSQVFKVLCAISLPNAILWTFWTRNLTNGVMVATHKMGEMKDNRRGLNPLAPFSRQNVTNFGLLFLNLDKEDIANTKKAVLRRYL
jgi:hypothetical protein